MTSQAKYDHVPLENASLHPFRQLLYLVFQENDTGQERERERGGLTFISLILGGCTNLPIDLLSACYITIRWKGTYKDRRYSRVVGDTLINLVFLHSQPLFQ